jgi:hypothetical protein
MIEALGHGVHRDVAGSRVKHLRMGWRTAEREERGRARDCRRSHADPSSACRYNDAVKLVFQQARGVHIVVTAILTFAPTCLVPSFRKKRGRDTRGQP